MAIRPGDTPVPIPNTMVKARTADGTILATVWESRRLPGSIPRGTATRWIPWDALSGERNQRIAEQFFPCDDPGRFAKRKILRDALSGIYAAGQGV